MKSSASSTNTLPPNLVASSRARLSTSMAAFLSLREQDHLPLVFFMTVPSNWQSATFSALRRSAFDESSYNVSKAQAEVSARTTKLSHITIKPIKRLMQLTFVHIFM